VIKRKKYTCPEPEPEPKSPLFSKDEQKCLARLVAKFGPKTVADAAMIVPLPKGRGRPALSLEEADNLLWFIEKYTQEAKQDRSKHPVKDALKAVSEVTGLSLKTIKDKRRDAAKLVARMKQGPD
jgi:hypothetical protein